MDYAKLARAVEQFPSSSDAQLMRKFHAVPWNARISIVNELDDARFRELGYRLIHIEQAQMLPGSIRSQLDAWRQERLGGPTGAPYRTLADAIQEANNLDGTPDSDSRALVSDIKGWLANWPDFPKTKHSEQFEVA
jgi:hypothetical protein